MLLMLPALWPIATAVLPHPWAPPPRTRHFSTPAREALSTLDPVATQIFTRGTMCGCRIATARPGLAIKHSRSLLSLHGIHRVHRAYRTHRAHRARRAQRALTRPVCTAHRVHQAHRMYYRMYYRMYHCCTTVAGPTWLHCWPRCSETKGWAPRPTSSSTVVPPGA